ncbi:MAG: ribbon-helix-helix domain-containing protein [Planctomycetota bacterium]
MKAKTSVTLTSGLLEEIDRAEGFRSRSEFVEIAVRRLLSDRARAKRDRRDRAILDKRAAALNAEAEDVLAYQVPL